MKRLFVWMVAVLLTSSVGAQIKEPVGWTFSAQKKSADTYDLVIKAVVPKPWHLYSQFTPDGGPVATKFTFNANPLVKLEGKVKEIGKLQKIQDKIFETEVRFFSNEVTFVQTVKVKAGVKTNVTGSVLFMVCDDSQCLPPTNKKFDIKLQ